MGIKDKNKDKNNVANAQGELPLEVTTEDKKSPATERAENARMAVMKAQAQAQAEQESKQEEEKERQRIAEEKRNKKRKIKNKKNKMNKTLMTMRLKTQGKMCRQNSTKKKTLN